MRRRRKQALSLGVASNWHCGVYRFDPKCVTFAFIFNGGWIFSGDLLWGYGHGTDSYSAGSLSDEPKRSELFVGNLVLVLKPPIPIHFGGLATNRHSG